MSEVIKKRVRESHWKNVKVFLKNGFRYAGKLTNYDDEGYIEVLDDKTGSYKILAIADIQDMEVSKE